MNYYRRDIPNLLGVKAPQTQDIPPWHMPTRDLGILVIEIALILCILRFAKLVDDRIRRQRTRSLCSEAAVPTLRNFNQCTITS